MEDNRLKQRLTGAVVLVALAVIFIPMLLSGGRDMEMPVFGSNVPERSAEITNIKHIDVEEMQKNTPRSVNPERVPVAKGMPEPKIVKTPPSSIIEDIKKATTSSKVQKTTTEPVWAVQVGSFSKKNNALLLQDKLRGKKHNAFVDRIVRNNKAVYRVRVGPETTKEKAEALKTKLKKEMKLSGLVVKHP